MRAPGRMGGDKVTVRNLRVIDVDVEKHTVIVTGAVPGARGSYVVIRKAVAPRRQVVSQADEDKNKKKGK